MGEILSKDTVDLLKNEEVQKAFRNLVINDQAKVSAPVSVKTPSGATATVTFEIASS